MLRINENEDSTRDMTQDTAEEIDGTNTYSARSSYKNLHDVKKNSDSKRKRQYHNIMKNYQQIVNEVVNGPINQSSVLENRRLRHSIEFINKHHEKSITSLNSTTEQKSPKGARVLSEIKISETPRDILNLQLKNQNKGTRNMSTIQVRLNDSVTLEKPICKTSLRVRKLKPISDTALRNSMNNTIDEYKKDHIDNVVTYG